MKHKKTLTAIVIFALSAGTVNIANTIEYLFTKHSLKKQEQTLGKLKTYYNAIDLAFSKYSLLESIATTGQRGAALEYLQSKVYYCPK